MVNGRQPINEPSIPSRERHSHIQPENPGAGQSDGNRAKRCPSDFFVQIATESQRHEESNMTWVSETLWLIPLACL